MCSIYLNARLSSARPRNVNNLKRHILRVGKSASPSAQLHMRAARWVFLWEFLHSAASQALLPPSANRDGEGSAPVSHQSFQLCRKQLWASNYSSDKKQVGGAFCIEGGGDWRRNWRKWRRSLRQEKIKGASFWFFSFKSRHFTHNARVYIYVCVCVFWPR